MSVFFYGCVTLDGCLADKSHGLSWLYETGTSVSEGVYPGGKRLNYPGKYGNIVYWKNNGRRKFHVHYI